MYDLMATHSSSAADECISRAVDFLHACDNETYRKSCVDMLVKVERGFLRRLHSLLSGPK